MRDAEIRLKEIRGFHVGGHLMELAGLPMRTMPTIRGRPDRQIDPNGTYAVGQMYVQEFRLAEPRARELLQLWHGGGLTGACWETTPDGRPGWLSHFLRHGHDVALCDASERGRAGWAPYPTINAGAPWHRTMEMAWEIFRIGPAGGYHREIARRRAFANTQFPVDHADQLLRQFVARWGSRQSDQWAVAAYREYLKLRPDSVIIAHSQGGLYAFDAAIAADRTPRGLICIEPVLPPEPDFPFERLREVPVLIVLGDNLTAAGGHDAFVRAGRAAGMQIELWRLPEMGIRGNSHMIMMDQNSEAVADHVRRWMRDVGLAA
jgi:hypothetical protein